MSFSMDWLDLLAGQGTLKSLLQHHSSKASILRRSAFFTVQLSHPYMTTGKTIALTRWTFVGKVMSLLLNMLSKLVITLLPRSKRLLTIVTMLYIIFPWLMYFITGSFFVFSFSPLHSYQVLPFYPPLATTNPTSVSTSLFFYFVGFFFF